MKKTIALILSLCIMLLSCGGCSSTERAAEQEMEIDDIKTEVYEKAYEEGYQDAVEAVVYELPWYFVDMEELEEALYAMFDDGEYAEEVRDQIMTCCEVYESEDFVIEYSRDGMDYGY